MHMLCFELRWDGGRSQITHGTNSHFIVHENVLHIAGSQSFVLGSMNSVFGNDTLHNITRSGN